MGNLRWSQEGMLLSEQSIWSSELVVLFLIFYELLEIFFVLTVEKICRWVLQRGLNYIFWMKDDEEVKFQSLIVAGIGWLIV